MTDNRIRTILLMLYPSGTVCSSQEMAEAMGVSTRTVKEDIRALRAMLRENGACIEAQMSKGYLLRVTDAERFAAFFRKATLDTQRACVPATRHERVDYIIKKLLSVDYYLQIDNLANELLVSRTTITRDMRDVRAQLAEFGLLLNVKPNYGIMLKGREVDKRLCISEHFFHSDMSYFAADNAMFRSEFNQKEIGQISQLLRMALDRYTLYLNTNAFENMTVHLLIALRRWQFYNYVQIDNITRQRLEGSDELYAAAYLLELLEKNYDLILPDDEALYFALHLKSKCLQETPENMINRQIGVTMERIYRMLKESYGFIPPQPTQFDNYMRLHLPGMVQRIRSRIIARNPLKYDIFAQYPLAVHISIDICRLICEQYGVCMNADEFSYIVMYVNLLFLERKKSNMRIALVCYQGRSEAAVLMNELSGPIENYFQELTICTWRDAQLMPLDSYDLVLTTIPGETHLRVASEYLGGEPSYSKNLRRIICSAQRRRIELQTYIRPNRFLCSINAADREDVLGQIAALFTKKEAVFEILCEAENYLSGELGNSIAFLHIIKPLPENFVLFAGLKRPIIWKKQMIQAIFWVNSQQHDLVVLETLYSLLRERLEGFGDGVLRLSGFAEYRAWLLGEEG